MIRSMTGYGAAEQEVEGGRLSAEVKTVNHRFLNANVSLPRSLSRHEATVRDELGRHLERGHVNFTLRFEATGYDPDRPSLVLDEERARQYLGVLGELATRLGVPGQPDINLLARFGDIIVAEDPEPVEIDPADIRQVTSMAARQAVGMREDEGRGLQADLEERLSGITAAIRRIRELAPVRLHRERDRLRAAVAELAGDVEVDEDRLAREIAYLAERWDISEETVRLDSHVRLFEEALDGSAEDPVGKRLGFLVQEMHREANTIGSKSNDAAIDREVIEIKNEVERLREQVDNVE